MPFNDLIYYLPSSSRTCTLSEIGLQGSRLAIDAERIILEAICPHGVELHSGKETKIVYDVIIRDIDRYCKYFRSSNVQMLFVFRGLKLPGLSQWYKEQAEIYGDNRCWIEYYKFKKRPVKYIAHQANQVTFDMRKLVIDYCKKENIDYLVAPYEAHAQLAYLSIQNLYDFILSDDMNLILFGASKVIVSLELSEKTCLLYERDKLHLGLELDTNMEDVHFEKFRWTILLSGCHYLHPPDKTIVFSKAKQYIFHKKYEKYDHYMDVIPKLTAHMAERRYLGLITNDYLIQFGLALECIKYHLVYDPRSHRLKPCNKYPRGHISTDYPHAGRRIQRKELAAIIAGCMNLDRTHCEAFGVESTEQEEEEEEEETCGDECEMTRLVQGKQQGEAREK